MKTACPACGALSSLDVLIGHEGARDAVVVSLSLPAPLGKLLVQYLALFRPPQRSLAMDRVASLLCELKPMIADARIARNGRIWSAPQDYWRMALEEMLAKRDKLTLPLKGHGYLLAIIEGYSNKAEAQAEQKNEDRKAGRTPVGGLHQPAAPCVNSASGLPDSGLPALGAPQPSPCEWVPRRFAATHSHGEGGRRSGEGKPRSIMPPEVKAALKKMQVNPPGVDRDDHS